MHNETKVINELIDGYKSWLAGKITVECANVTIITTPFLDAHNDYIQVSVRKNADGTYLLRSEFDGYVGESSRLTEKMICGFEGVDIEVDDYVLYSFATADNFSARLDNLVQSAMVASHITSWMDRGD